MKKRIIPSELPFRAYSGKEPYIFVSYAHADKDIVYPEMFWMNEKGFHIWYDEGIPPASEWPAEIANALLNCNIFLVFITPNAIESKNVRDEINYALNHNKKVLPIFLKPTELKHGLDLRIGNLQYIKKFELKAEYYMKKILDALKIVESKEIENKTELKSAEKERIKIETVEVKESMKAMSKIEEILRDPNVHLEQLKDIAYAFFTGYSKYNKSELIEFLIEQIKSPEFEYNDTVYFTNSDKILLKLILNNGNYISKEDLKEKYCEYYSEGTFNKSLSALEVTLVIFFIKKKEAKNVSIRDEFLKWVKNFVADVM